MCNRFFETDVKERLEGLFQNHFGSGLILFKILTFERTYESESELLPRLRVHASLMYHALSRTTDTRRLNP